MNSRSKGKRGEREAARELERIGLGDSRRGQQFSGIEGRDVICSGLPDVHIESKRCESLSLYVAMEQAVRDCNGRLPVVMHKRNRRDWLVIVRTDNLVDFARQVLAARMTGAPHGETTCAAGKDLAP